LFPVFAQPNQRQLGMNKEGDYRPLDFAALLPLQPPVLAAVSWMGSLLLCCFYHISKRLQQRTEGLGWREEKYGFCIREVFVLAVNDITAEPCAGCWIPRYLTLPDADTGSAFWILPNDY
jgi:hypothetical protein